MPWFYWFYTPAVWFYTWFYPGSVVLSSGWAELLHGPGGASSGPFNCLRLRRLSQKTRNTDGGRAHYSTSAFGWGECGASTWIKGPTGQSVS